MITSKKKLWNETT